VTCVLLEHWDFCAQNFDKAWDLLDKLARDTYEFEISCANSCTPPPCFPNYAYPVCEICHHYNHDSNFYPCHISADSFARVASVIEIMN